MASLVENVFTLARGSFLLWTPKTLRNLLRFAKYFNNPALGHFQFVLHLYIFHLYLIIDKNTEKGMYLVIQERFSSNIWYVTIFCKYPVSLKLLLNILYPNNFCLKYPVSR